MLASMLARVAPHPPFEIPLFAMGPFLGAALAAALASLAMGDEATRSGRALAVMAALMGLVSFGPQKYADAAFGQIWPGVIAAQVAILVVIHRTAWSSRRTIAGREAGHA